ncbi:SOS response-associated peptidase [Paenibacillus chungangensis]|uniref:Abasic site processing protein n=1 Tax=Paenibacillus chungangensis TaxID=696535 RepID=A0ABW3HQE4_9BACL
MIERFSLTAKIDEIMEKFDVRKVLDDYANRYNIAPTQSMSIVMNDRHNVRVVAQSRWGLFPFWAKDSVNADYEKLGEKPFLQRMLKRQRCIVPCSGFYGQKQFGQEKDPRAMHTIVNGRSLFGVAGIYDCWRNGSGKEVRAFTMLTAAASGTLSTWQPRVPVVMDEEGIEAWLDPRETEMTVLRRHLEGLDGHLMRSYPVTNQVRNDQYESPECIREIRIDYA